MISRVAMLRVDMRLCINEEPERSDYFLDHCFYVRRHSGCQSQILGYLRVYELFC